MILLTGGTGYTGQRVAAALVAAAAPVRCLVRSTSPPVACQHLAALGCELRQGDLEQTESVRAAMAGVEVVLHLAHIRHAPQVLAAAGAGVVRLVLTSSQRAVSQVPAASVQEVLAGEEAVAASALPCVLLRPTMIYGPGDDRNVSRLAARLRRRRWLLVVGPGTARQQPVFVEDVVQALLAAGQGAGRAGGVYTLAGPEAFPFNRMVDMVAEALGVRVRRLHVPLALGLLGVRLARAAGVSLGVTTEQLRRLQEDKACSIAAAREELGFAPLSFAAGLARALVPEKSAP